ncbi:protein phosphatase 1A-like isoform X1 [Denticeps clupeoides]|uniref:protein phosphatase 1A-like isoform X1 n=1 Tax=Denticeps clupeoides TaxID=299321 RepID=UPI0010A59652|nr:protein phosphatase 1A-like isoform X1 [Denticeps clupeoides]
MGAFLNKPKVEKHTARGEGNGLRFGVSSMQGWRAEMEDAHSAVVGLPRGLAAWSFFAVYDGHAGTQVAQYCCQHLLEHITGNADFQAGPGDGDGGDEEEPSVESVVRGVRTGFLQIDEHMRGLLGRRHAACARDRSGSTAVAVMVSPRHIFFINCGDSRGLLSRAGAVHFSTQDHKPGDPRERERIQNAGGAVLVQRVNGSLAVSRALGDFAFKRVRGKGPTEQLVSPEPEVSAIRRCPAGDEFVVLACDGIWDVMSNDELCDFVRSRLQVHGDLERVCSDVIDTCLYKGSRDNMSVVLVCLGGAPSICPEAVRRDAELDQFLEQRVQEILRRSSGGQIPDLVNVMRTLATESIPNLPPGGELASKRSVVEAAYNKVQPCASEDTVSRMGQRSPLLPGVQLKGEERPTDTTRPDQ